LVTRGPHRRFSAEAMLERVRPFMALMGITRVGMLTGLDVVGIPVAAAYRPNSRSIAVHQGKGQTAAAAKVSAVMEAAECWHAETAEPLLRLATGEEIARHGEAVDPASLPRAGPGDPWGDPAGERLLWMQARNAVSGGPIWVPFELVSADFTAPAPAGFGHFRQTTNGLASGGSQAEAVLQGLCEAVERDAVARWHAAGDAGQAACCVDPASVAAPASCWLLARFAEAGVAVRIWDITGDIALPAFMALACDADGVAGVEPELGAGCHPSADVALARALAEAAQARLTRISGARDDFPPDSFTPRARGERHGAAQRLLRMSPRLPFRDDPGGASSEAELEAALGCLRRAGFGQVACVDLSRPELGIPVARVIVPGLANG
jgi:ribosomal protein S12 methylthiotransferase accessory factor